MKGMVINMKKTIIAAFLTLTLLLSFTACADNKEGTQKETDRQHRGTSAISA